MDQHTQALVISGGGSKGAFAIGVLLTLREHSSDWTFKHYVGTSTGALIVPLALLEEYSLLQQLYTSVTTADILKKYNVLERLFQQSLFDSTPLWNLINTYYTDERCERLLSAQRYVYLTATCLQTERLTVFTSHPQPEPSEHYDLEKLTSPDHLRKAILASASQPVFMTPVKVNLHVAGALHPQHQYVDGGVLQYAGIEMAIDQGAQDILTILLSPAAEKTADKEFKGLLSILQQTIGIFTSDVGKNDLIIPLKYNDALVYIDAVKKKMVRSGLSQATVEEYFHLIGPRNPYEGKIPLNLPILRPEQPLGGGPGGLDFHPDEMKKMLERGRAVAARFLQNNAVAGSQQD